MYGLAPDTCEKIKAMFESGSYSIKQLAIIFRRDPAHIRDVIANTSG